MFLLAWVLAGAAPAAAAPNVVVIETDDQTVSDMASMPITRALVGDQGVTFANSVVSLSQCCPSRATFLSGQYAHNTEVWSIKAPWGGYERFRGEESLPVWLRRAGYRTAVVGKYLNGYGFRDPFEIPAGWTDFQGLLSNSTYNFYGYTLNDRGRLVTYGDDPLDFQTDVITDRSVGYIRAQRGPFFLWTTYVAPHIGRPRELADPIGRQSAVPAPRHRNAFLGVPVPRTPSFNEADVRDQPRGVRAKKRLNPARLAVLQEAWRRRQASLLSVDEGVRRIVDALRETGQLENTLLIFTSDNGFMQGQHRITTGKVVPYEPSIRVPLMMRGPGIAAGTTRDELVWNGDLAPTVLDAAGAKAHGIEPDGVSLLRPVPPGRPVVLEGPPGRGTDGIPRFTGLRTDRFKYVESLRGEVQLYDLADDPDETQNLAARPQWRATRERLARRLDALRDCVGAGCR